MQGVGGFSRGLYFPVPIPHSPFPTPYPKVARTAKSFHSEPLATFVDAFFQLSSQPAGADSESVFAYPKLTGQGFMALDFGATLALIISDQQAPISFRETFRQAFL